jgi:hypothetical protein
MNIIIPTAVRIWTLALYGHIVGPEKRFLALRAMNFEHGLRFPAQEEWRKWVFFPDIIFVVCFENYYNCV